MCTSSSALTPLSLLLFHGHSLSPRRRLKPPMASPITFLTHYSLRNPTRPISSVITDISSHISWLSPDDPVIDGFGGWAFPESPAPKKKTGFPTFLVAGFGASVALLLAAIAHFSLTKNGFKLSFRRSSPGSLVLIDVEAAKTKPIDSDAPSEENDVPEASVVDSSDVVTETMISEKHQPRIFNVSVDSNQQEAVHVLKKLKIIDEDVKADELCTRREYARWLVRANSLLERNPRYKITMAVALSGSVLPAYEDVTVGDQDFDSIQALAEAGVMLSKLSSKHKFDGGLKFFPERFMSRRDLIEWRAQLEYDFASTGNQEILETKLDLMDVREISSEEWPGLRMDMLAGDKSLLRRVFGQIRRLQPNKPTTIAQAAVALTSGRMTEAIQNELLRIEAEKSSRQVAKEEIKQELLDRGEIERFWAEKIKEEEARGLEVKQQCKDALKDLEDEKIVREGAFNGFLKEKAAMDCQKQLLNGLKEEVNEMSERLVSERNEQTGEEETVQALRLDLQAKMEGVLDAKSLLEAEIEALQILRSWVEDEARKSKARSKVLEEVGLRWKTDRLY